MSLRYLGPEDQSQYKDQLRAFCPAVHKVMRACFPESIDAGLTALFDALLYIGSYYASKVGGIDIYKDLLDSIGQILQMEKDQLARGQHPLCQRMAEQAKETGTEAAPKSEPNPFDRFPVDPKKPIN